MDENNFERINSMEEGVIAEQEIIPKAKSRKRRYRNIAIIAVAVNVFVLTGIFAAGYFVGSDRLLSGITSAETGSGEGNKVVTPEVESGKKLTTQEIAKLVGPAVVGIVSEVETSNPYWGRSVSEASGSGIIFKKEGTTYYILTNNHVIDGASSVSIHLAGDESFDGEIVGNDENTDLAVVKIKSDTDLTVAKLGDSDKVEVGETAIAIGNPLGMEFFGTVTQGIISATNRLVKISDDFTMNYIQTDAAINSGNSGGALVNAYGEIIGVNSAKISDGSVEGMGFAIPISEAKVVAEDLIQYGYVKGRPVIGITTVDVTENIAMRYGWPQGVWVNEVQKGSGAETAGLRRGDIIIKVNDKKVTSVGEINAIKNKLKPGDKLKLRVYREGEDEMDITVVLMENNPVTSK